MADEISSSFGRDSRLRTLSQLQVVRRTGRSKAGQYCVVNILIPPPDGCARAAFSISRRYSKLAVVRNRARRIFREVYRRIYGVYTPFWIIFVPRRRMMDVKMEAVLSEVEDALKELGISSNS